MCQFHYVTYACRDRARYQITWCDEFVRLAEIESDDTCGVCEWLDDVVQDHDCRVCSLLGRVRQRMEGYENGEILSKEAAGIEVVEVYEGAIGGSEQPSASQSFPTLPMAEGSMAAQSQIGLTGSSWRPTDVEDWWQPRRDLQESQDWVFRELDDSTKSRPTHSMLAARWNTEFPDDKRNSQSFSSQIYRSPRLKAKWNERAPSDSSS